MASRVVLKVTPAAGTRFEKVYPRAKMDGLDHVPLILLANESAESAEKQLRDSFPNFAAAKNGSMEMTVKLVDLIKPVSKPLYTILDCARRDDPNLLEMDTDKGTLPIDVDFKAVPRAKGPKGSTQDPNNAPDNEDLVETTGSVYKGNNGAQGRRGNCQISTNCHPIAKEVMDQYFPRDAAGAYYMKRDNKVPEAWLQGMVSAIQVKMHKNKMAVDQRPNIIHHLFKTAARQNNTIHGSDTRQNIPSDEELQSAAKKGKEWQRRHGATLDAGNIPEELTKAHRKAAKKGLLPAEGSDSEDPQDMSESEQTPANHAKRQTRTLGRGGRGRGGRGGSRQRAGPPNGKQPTDTRSAQEEDTDGNDAGSEGVPDMEVPLLAFTMAGEKSQTAQAAADVEGRAKKPPGRTAKRPRESAQTDTAAAAAAATRSLANAAKTKAEGAEQAYEKVQKAFTQKSDVYDKLASAAGPTGSDQLKKAEQNLDKARAQHDKAMRAMNAAQQKFESLDAAASTLEDELAHQ